MDLEEEEDVEEVGEEEEDEVCSALEGGCLDQEEVCSAQEEEAQWVWEWACRDMADQAQPRAAFAN